VQAEEGQPVDRSIVEPGSELVGTRPANVNTLLNRASEVAPTAQDTLNEIRRSLQRLEKISPLAEETLREYRDLARAARQEIPNLEATNKEIQGLAKEVRATLPKAQRDLDDFGAAARNWGKLGERLDVWAQGNLENLTKAVDNLNTVLLRISSVFNEENQRYLMTILKNTSKASERFDSITRNLDTIMQDSRPLPKHMNDTLTRMDVAMDDLRKTFAPYTARSESTARNLDESTAKLNRMLSDFSGLTRVLDQDGTIQRLLKDPSLYNNLNDAACMVLKSVPRLDRIVKDFETFADKLARHPELLGVRGAVRPSEGLKEPAQPFNRPMIVPGGP
jgi:ABC-type transporter Mla subunit MlaD